MYTHTNRGGGLLQRSHCHLQFPTTSLCIPVAVGLYPSEAILARVHIQVPKYFLMRNYRHDLSLSKVRNKRIVAKSESWKDSLI